MGGFVFFGWGCGGVCVWVGVCVCGGVFVWLFGFCLFLCFCFFALFCFWSSHRFVCLFASLFVHLFCCLFVFLFVLFLFFLIGGNQTDIICPFFYVPEIWLRVSNDNSSCDLYKNITVTCTQTSLWTAHKHHCDLYTNITVTCTQTPLWTVQCGVKQRTRSKLVSVLSQVNH